MKHTVEVMIPEAEIKARIAELGRQITEHYKDSGSEMVLVGLLRGSFMFMADLCREVHVPHEVDFMTASSYGSGMSTTRDVKILKDLDAILIPGGFGYRGVEGKIATARYARENNIPYLGICLGMQVALIEFARNVAGMENANSTEFVPDCKYPVVALITEWRDEDGNVEVRTEKSDLGGTMRLGAQACQLTDDSVVRKLYGEPVITERHRHRYEVNNMLLKQIEAAGLRVAGRSGDDQLVEIIEVPNHPWFVACQFHPEFTSTPRDGHPLFAGFVKAASEYQKRQAK